MGGRGEGRIGARRVAGAPVEADIARHFRRQAAARLARVRRSAVVTAGKRLVVDDHQLGGIERLRRSVSATISATGSPAKRTLPSASSGCGAKAKGSPVWTLAST